MQVGKMKWGKLRLLQLSLLGGIAAAGLSGCSTWNEKLTTNGAFPVNQSIHPNGPAVAILPIKESIQSDDQTFGKEPNYLGTGLRKLGTIAILPLVRSFTEFEADQPRTEVVRQALVAELTNRGIPAVDADGDVSRLKTLPEDHLAFAITIRELSADTDFSFCLPLIYMNTFEFNNETSHSVLDCQLLQPGQSAPIWQGSVDVSHSSTEFREKPAKHSNVLGEAVADAVEQCVSKSDLVNIRTKLSDRRYLDMMARAKETEEQDPAKALDFFSQAYASAATPERDLESMQGMARIIAKSNPAIPENARRFSVQAEAAVREKKFSEAADLFLEALRVSPWWAGGHYNRAIVLSELGSFDVAIMEMKRYLLLKPKARDARMAQDMIYEWEAKAPAAPAVQPGAAAIQSPAAENAAQAGGQPATAEVRPGGWK